MLLVESLKVVKERKWIFLALFIVALFSFTVFQVVAADSLMQVTINGTQQTVKSDSTLEQILEQFQIKLVSGALRNVQGEIIDSSGGGAPILMVNGQSVPLDTQIHPGDEIVLRNGQDFREALIEEKIPLPFAVEEKGKGTKQKVIQQGQDGLKVIIKGSISGIVLEQRVIKEAITKVVYYYTPEQVPAKAAVVNKAVRYVGVPGEKVVALTFDDGPGVYTPQVLNILAHYQVKATFFMVGDMVNKYPELARQVVQQGHVLGNHTMNHRNLIKLNNQDVLNQIVQGADSIKRATGYEVKIMRPPGGNYNPLTQQILNKTGYQLIMWSVDPQDWNHLKAAEIEHNVLTQVKAGSIILLHDGGGNRAETVKALPTIISTLQSRGYTFVTL